jgi:hypothetical protein
MVKCPFCGFDNEDGALFCEQCKSDLSAVPVTPAAKAAPHGGAPHGKEPIPVAAVVEENVPMAAVVEDERPGDIPMAAVVEAAPPPEDLVRPAPLPEMAPPLTPEEIAAFAPPTTPAPPPAASPEAAAAAAQAAPASGASVPAGAAPKLEVIRGQKIKMEFPIYGDLNFIGRADEKPVDIDLEDQEPPDRVWCSRQHAVIHFDEAQSVITIEDLNSANGTYVNRVRVHPGQKKQLFVNDVIQIGTVHLKLKA